MMVTFVSQCEKKALNRTRRVLDAFADRIGDNTWQTVITQDGLLAVKKLLRKTASKNTAVGCHWIRSRARSDLVWVVGAKHKFNEKGIVPVNYTSKEVIMDKLPIETKHVLANTHQQPLSQHLFAVGYLAYHLIRQMKVEQPKLASAVFIAGILHDIGKLDPQFQTWLNKKIAKQEDQEKPDDGYHIDKSVQGFTKFTFEDHPRHNELSWLFTEALLAGNTSLNTDQKQQISHGVYWHHTKPFRVDDTHFNTAKGLHKLFNKSLKDVFTINEIHEQAISVLKEVKHIASYFEDDDFSVNELIPKWENTFSLTGNEIPQYKIYCEISETCEEFRPDLKKNALNNIIRTSVISADRIISAMSKEDLREYLNEGTLLNALDDIVFEESTLSQNIVKCLEGFNNQYPESERNIEQSKTAGQLARLKEIAEFDEVANIGVLQGPAGCGKTKIALEWAEKTEVQKIIWVCPRVQVCLGLLHDLTQNHYLPNNRIEIFTGEFKHILKGGMSIEDAGETPADEYLSGDIVITTIDQVVNNIISHTKATLMVDFMKVHIVFDEFHELVSMPAYNLLFAELIESKKLQKQHANTLLISATPHDLFVTELLAINDQDIVRIKSFNSSNYKINLQIYNDKEDLNPLIHQEYSDTTSTFVITNTAKDAQEAFLRHQANENNILIHSKYTKRDKMKWFNKVFNSFKQQGSHEYDVLRSGPIVQASLNISCDRMVTELTSAENWLQRLGRLDRFGVNEAVNQYITMIPESSISGKQTNNTAKFLNDLCVWQSTVAWLDFLRESIADKESLTINEIYTIYQYFYQDEQCRSKVTQDLELALRKSVKLIRAKIIDPISVPPKSKKKSGVIKISKNSLRGDNRFVQMAVCYISDNLQASFVDEYAYDENTDHSKETIGLTESVERIRGFEDSDKNLLAVMKKKHHNIKESAKKAYKDDVLLGEARSPEFPIYLSYSPKDLEKVNAKPHPYAMYYVKTKKQPVGTMSLDQFKTLTLKENSKISEEKKDEQSNGY